MRIFALSCAVAAGLASGTSAVVAAPAIAASPNVGAPRADRPDLSRLLLTTRDLPKRYAAATEDPYRNILEELRKSECRLPIAVSESALFVTTDKQALEVESLTELIADPGPRAAKVLVTAAKTLPGRCATIETPSYSVYVTPGESPRAGDASAALRLKVDVKAVGSANTYVDALFAEVAVVADRGRAVVVVLVGYFEKHAVTLAHVTRKAVRKLH